MINSLQAFTPEIRSPLVAILLNSLRSPAIRRRVQDQFGISNIMLEGSLSAVPLARYVALFEELAVHHGDPLLGAHVGMSQSTADALGPLGFLLLASSTMRQGLDAISTHIGTWQTGTTIFLDMSNDEAKWIYRIDDQTIWPRRQDAEYTMATMYMALRSRLNKPWRPLEVHFEHEEPARASALHALFRAPLRFGQPYNRLILDPTDLDLPHDTPFACFIPYVEEYLRVLAPLQSDPPNILTQVRNVVRNALSHREVSLDLVALTLQISPRTLQRHLAAADTNLRTIIQEVRQSEAAALLENGIRKRADIAQALGYADHTALWRAARSWTDIPAQKKVKTDS